MLSLPFSTLCLCLCVLVGSGVVFLKGMNAETVKRSLIAKAESELFLDRGRPDAVSEGDTTFFTQTEYFNHDFSQYDLDPDRPPCMQGRTASAGRTTADERAHHRGRDHREARPGAPRDRTSVNDDEESHFADLVCELEPDVLGAHAGEGGY